MDKALFIVVGLTATWMVTSVASADERDPAAAQALFDEGRALMKTHRYPEACPKLAESQRLDPGIGTQFRLADCYEQQGKVASAWAAFLEVASLAAASGQTEREQTARSRATRLESRLPRLKIVVPSENLGAELKITRDGIVVGQAQWESALPVDPGEHQLAVTAPGRRPFSGTVTVKEGASTSFEVPRLELLPEASAAPGAPAPAEPPRQQPTPASVRPMPSEPLADVRAPVPSSGPSLLVIGLGSLGVIGLGAGTTLGLMARSKFGDSKHYCNAVDENRCSQRGVDLRDDAFVLGNGATAGFIVGGALLTGAGVLWLTSGSSKPSQASAQAVTLIRAGVQATPKRSALVVEGSF